MRAETPSVLLIYTGGTIGMIENPETGALENFNFDHLLKHVPELKRFNYRISSYQFDPPLDSSDMEPAYWAKLVKIINYNYDYFDGFVILHGTDTMAYTASALSFMLENLSKPVILTGSQLPIGTLRTDGKENLITAIEIAAAKNPDGTAIVPEVCIFFENHLMRGNRTTKINAENFNAFRSFNYPPLARVGIHIKYEPNLIRKPDPTKPFTPLELMARVNSQLRRYTRFMGMAQKKEEEGRNYVIGGLELNEDTIEFSVDGNPVKLTPIEFKILALLMRNPGRVFSTEEIYERVWNEKAINTDTIMVHVRNIRDKIEINPREPKYLKVVWGVGYKIEKQP